MQSEPRKTEYSFASLDMAPFRAICPNDIFVQGSSTVSMSRALERFVDSLKQFHVQWLATPCRSWIRVQLLLHFRNPV
jgi:hypothetical protein